MASNKFLTAITAVAATVSVAAFAGCAPGVPGGTTTPSAKPSTTTPSATPSGGATPAPTGSSPAATATPTPIPSTPDTSAKATVHGVVIDDNNSRLSGVTVTAKILGGGAFANGSDTLTTTTQVGSYALNGAPTGETILVTVSKSGMTTRQQTIVPLANLQGDPSANKLNFGEVDNLGSNVFAMSDRPEVTSMTPAHQASGVDPATSFTLTWNEPVNTNDVEDHFAVYIAGTALTDNYNMSAENGVTLEADLATAVDDGDSTVGDVRVADNFIYDEASFNVAWSNNNQTVTFTFKNGFKLPTDKEASEAPQYGVSFQGTIKDTSGVGRENSWFRISPAQVGRHSFYFTVATDTTKPRISSVTGVNKDDDDAAPTAAVDDRIRVKFSEQMHIFARNNGASLTLPTLGADRAAANVANWDYEVGDVLAAANNPAETPIAAKMYDGDDTYSTVELTPVQDNNLTNAAQSFTTGNTVWVEADTDINDPAGNLIESSNNAQVKSGKAV